VGIVSKSWQRESPSHEVRHPNCEEIRMGHRSDCKTGGRDWRFHELGTCKLKVYRLEGSSREAEIAKVRQENIGVLSHRDSKSGEISVEGHE
jgi:hypothetical protein